MTTRRGVRSGMQGVLVGALLAGSAGGPALAFDVVSVWRAQGVELGENGFPRAWDEPPGGGNAAPAEGTPQNAASDSGGPGRGSGGGLMLYSPEDGVYMQTGAGGASAGDADDDGEIFLHELSFAGAIESSFNNTQDEFWRGVMLNFWGLTNDPGGTSQNPDVVTNTGGVLLDNGLIVGASGGGRTLVCFTEIMGVCTEFGFSD